MSREDRGGLTVYFGALEVHITGTQRVTTTYYFAGGQRIAVRHDGGALYWLHKDHLGSASLSTDAGGNRYGELRYTPYGEERHSWGDTPTDHRFTGQKREDFGLYDYGARFYSPGVGRFISADTIVPDPGNPQSLNRYRYARNNPILYCDPDGHCEFVCATIILMTSLFVGVVATRASLRAPLVESYSTAADTFGMPQQVVAGVLDSEQALDTNLLDHVETGVYAFAPLAVTEQIIENQYPDPGPGIGNVHISTARSVSSYFAEQYPDSEDMQLNIHNKSTAEATKLLTKRRFNIKVATATMRQLADYRFGSNGQPLAESHADFAEWTIADAVAIWHGYRYGVSGVSPYGMGVGFTLEDFQNRNYTLDELISRATGVGAEESMYGSIPYFGD